MLVGANGDGVIGPCSVDPWAGVVYIATGGRYAAISGAQPRTCSLDALSLRDRSTSAGPTGGPEGRTDRNRPIPDLRTVQRPAQRLPLSRKASSSSGPAPNRSSRATRWSASAERTRVGCARSGSGSDLAGRRYEAALDGLQDRCHVRRSPVTQIESSDT
jgi:hypothetical protein